MSYYLDCVRIAEQRLSGAPKSMFSRRVERRGELVVPFILPLGLAAPQNQSRRAGVYRRHEQRRKILREMSAQALLWRSQNDWYREFRFPLPGRPQVNAVRFTTRMTDAYANFAKEAIDCLQPSQATTHGHGLGIIAGDTPRQIEENQWCELVRRNDPTFVYLEVRTDA